MLDKESVLTKGTFLLNWDEVWNLFRQGMGSRKLQDPVVCRPISDNPGLTFNQGFFNFSVQKPFRENFPYSFLNITLTLGYLNLALKNPGQVYSTTQK